MAETDIELGRPNPNAASAHGPEHYFLQEFGMFLDSTANMVDKLKEANQEFNSVTEPAAMKEIKGRMEEVIDEASEKAHIMKEKLRKMIMDNTENRKNPGREKVTAKDMSRIIALKAKLKERKSDLQNLGKTVRQEYLEVIQRRTFTVTGIKLSDEVIRVIDAGSVVQMFENALQGTSAEQMAAAVAEVEERHAAATDLGKKIREVEQIFEGMVLIAALVETGEKANKAMNQVRKLEIRARSTDEELRGESAEKGRLLVLIGLWCLFVGLCLIILPALASG